MSEMSKELTTLLNRHSAENGSNTPDFILARFLQDALRAFELASNSREQWYGISSSPKSGTSTCVGLFIETPPHNFKTPPVPPPDRVPVCMTEEPLAALAHDQWSGWMRYLFSKCAIDSRGEKDGLVAVRMPVDLLVRWARQMSTSYADLPEDEKESDRKEARRVLDLLYLTPEERRQKEVRRG